MGCIGLWVDAWVSVIAWIGCAFFLASWVGCEWAMWRMKRTSARLIREGDQFWADLNRKLSERAEEARMIAAGERAERA